MSDPGAPATPPLPAAAPGDPAFAPRGRVVRAAEVRVWHEGAGYLEAARAEAARIVVAAQEERRRLVEAGRREGEAAAAAATTRRMAEATGRIDALLAGCEGWMADLVADTVARILGDRDRRETTLQAAAHALREFRHARRLVVRVPAAAVEWVDAGLAGCLEPALRAILVIQPDAAMAEGRCVVSCEFGTVEAGIDDQVAALRAGLAGPDRGEAGDG